MKTRRKVWVWSVRVSLLALAVFALAVSFATPARAQTFTVINPPPFDFSDSFYFNNGFNMGKFTTFGPRVGNDQRDPSGCASLDPNCGENGANSPPGVGHWEVDNSNTDPTRRNIRVKQTTGGFDADGDLIYYSIFAPVPDQTFFDLNNPAVLLDEDGDPLSRQGQPLTVGQVAQETMDLAERFRAFLFPIQGRDGDTRYVTDPCDAAVAPGPGVFGPGGAAYNCFMRQPPPVNRRQDNIFETTDTYSCRNVTGMWKLTFVTFTQKGLTDPKAIKKANELALKNGRTLDGLPVFESLKDLLEFESNGWALFSFPLEGSVTARPPTAAPRWVV